LQLAYIPERSESVESLAPKTRYITPRDMMNDYAGRTRLRKMIKKVAKGIESTNV